MDNAMQQSNSKECAAEKTDDRNNNAYTIDFQLLRYKSEYLTQISEILCQIGLLPRFILINKE